VGGAGGGVVGESMKPKGITNLTPEYDSLVTPERYSALVAVAEDMNEDEAAAVHRHYDILSKHFTFSSSCLNASFVICNYIEEAEERHRWSNTCVVTMLAIHSVELFLKGAILAKGEKPEVTHNLEKLKSQYDRLYSDKCFKWHLPFQVLSADIKDKEYTDAVKKSKNQPAMPFRYPADTEWKESIDIGIFFPESFRVEKLESLKKTYERIIPKIIDIAIEAKNSRV